MSSAVWPAQLPAAPRLSAYSQTSPNIIVKSKTDAGPGKARRRTTAGSETCDIELVLTRQQVALLKHFFMQSVAGGALAFEWKHHETGNAIDYRFLTQPTFRPQAPRQEHAQEIWIARFQLETMPGTEVEDDGSGGDPDPIDPPPTPAGGGSGNSFGSMLGGIWIEIGGDRPLDFQAIRNFSWFPLVDGPADPGPFLPVYFFASFMTTYQQSPFGMNPTTRFGGGLAGGGGAGGGTVPTISVPGASTLSLSRTGGGFSTGAGGF